MPYVAILTDTFTQYQRQFIDPIAERLRLEGYGVVVVLGRELKPDIRSSQPTYNDANRIFSVAKGYAVSGYIVLGGCIGHNLKRGELDLFVRGFTHAPVVCVGVDLPSVHSVTSKSNPGMRLLMEHLTEDTSRRKFVFLRGFRHDDDSLEREAIFRYVLKQRGIPVDERLMLTGNYIPIDAYNALDQALTEHPGVDAVVAANDCMAIAALRVLKKHGYRIPTDVVVTGYDDSVEARDSSPPLTSVVQPIDEQVVATVDTLLTLMRSEKPCRSVGAAQYFTGSLKIRESSRHDESIDDKTDLAYSGSLEQALDRCVETFIRDHASIIKPDKTGGYAVLFHMICQRLKGQSTWFEDLLEDLDRDANFGRRDLGWWREFENVLSAFTLRLSQVACFSVYMPHLIRMQLQLSRLTWSLNNSIQFDAERVSLLQSRLQAMLAKCDCMESVYEVLDVYLDKYRVKRAFLVLYNSTGGAVDCVARLAYAYREGHSESSASLPSEQPHFESRDLLPKALLTELNTGTLVLNPLYVDDKQFGYLLVDPDDAALFNHEYLSYTLSNTIKQLSRHPVVKSKIDRTV